MKYSLKRSNQLRLRIIGGHVNKAIVKDFGMLGSKALNGRNTRGNDKNNDLGNPLSKIVNRNHHQVICPLKF